jgi:non-specific serine/threonine protein kinase
VDDMLPEVSRLDGMHRKGLVLSSLTRLKQICNHPTLYLKDNSQLADRSGKLNRLEELLEVILAEDDKTLIFTQYAQMGFLLQDHLSKKFSQEVLFLHGSLSKKKRMNLIDSFQKPDGPKIFILSLKAGGFGLNLTEANQVIHYDQWWNPAVEDQATDRAHRIGQKKNVQVRKFICKGTLEEKIASLLARKKDLADSIVGSARNTITEMSVDDLRDLLQLSTGGEKKSSKGGSPDEPPFMEMSK